MRTLYRQLLGTIMLLCAAVVPSTTAAFFSDREEAAAQRFVASELVLAVDGPQSSLRVGPVLGASVITMLGLNLSAESIPAHMAVETVATAGNATFCESLTLTITRGTSSATGAVTSFASPQLSDFGNYNATVTYDTSERTIPHGAYCEVTLAVEAWQQSMPRATAGFRDTQALTIRIEAVLVVLNEVLAAPGAGFPEFIELYNLSEQPVDVAGWTITELAGENVVPHTITGAPSTAADLVAYDDSLTTTVPALGYLALKFNGGSAYLNNTGDTITLFDGVGNQLDQYVYTTSLPGKSDARIPDGTGPWIDPIPTPGEQNLLMGGEDSPVPVTENQTETVPPPPTAEPLVATPTESGVETTPSEPHEEETETEPAMVGEQEEQNTESPATAGEDEVEEAAPEVVVRDEAAPLEHEVEEPHDPPLAKTEDEPSEEAVEEVSEPSV